MVEATLDIYPPKPERAPRRDGAEARAGSAAFNKALADILMRGYVLTSEDVDTIGTFYGFSEHGGTPHLTQMSGREAMEAAGIDFTKDRYRGRYLFYDGSIPPEQTDREQVEIHLDEVVNPATVRGGVIPKRAKLDSMLF